jgi:hypothetical protein
MADLGEKPLPGNDDGGEEGNTTMRTAETLLRLLPTALCVVALVIMLKNSQSSDFGSLTYSDLGAFRYWYMQTESVRDTPYFQQRFQPFHVLPACLEPGLSFFLTRSNCYLG